MHRFLVLTPIHSRSLWSPIRSSDSPDGRITTSVLNYVPSPEDQGTPLLCIASNPRDTTNFTIHDSWTLDIYCTSRNHLNSSDRLIYLLHSARAIHYTHSRDDCHVVNNARHTPRARQLRNARTNMSQPFSGARVAFPK